MSETERFEIVRSLGRDTGAFVARDREARRLVVLERVKRATLSPENADALLRRARLLAASPHPCVERVREAIESDDTITLVTEYVDGEWLSALKDAKPRPSLEVLLRILLDAMRGLGAMLELMDAEERPAPLVHGALSPEAVLVTPQGTTIVSRFARGVPRLGDVRPDAAYIPFEVLRGRRSPDERTDVYSIGAMLWESLTGERPRAGMSLSEIIETATETRVPPARVPPARVPSSAPWAEPLAEIAWRALALDPEERQRDVIAVAAEVRRIAGARVADPEAVEEFMRSVGAVVRVRERRASLERGDEEEAPPVSSSQLLSDSDIQVVRMPPLPSVRPKPAPPPLRMSSPPREASAPAPPAQEAEPLREAPQAERAEAATPAPDSVRTSVESEPTPELPSGERASLEEVMATPPKLPTPGPPVSDITITEARDSAQPKVVVELPAADASELPDPEKEREAWERRQPTIRPQNRPARPARSEAAPPPRKASRSWTVAMLAVAMGFGWWLGRRSAESESSLATMAHAGDLVPSASCACAPPAAAATSVVELVTLSPVTHPAGSANGAGPSTPLAQPVTPATTLTTPTAGTPLTTPPPSAVKPAHQGLPGPKTVVVVEPNPSPPHPPPSAEPAATAPPRPKEFEPAEP